MSFADKFNLYDGLVILRLTCGGFFLPHLYAKFFVPEALGFFVAAGFKPPKVWMYIACAVEAVLAVGLILDIYTVWLSWLAALHLCVAAGAVYKVSDGKWLWNIGGYEYPTFWATACCVLAMMHP